MKKYLISALFFSVSFAFLGVSIPTQTSASTSSCFTISHDLVYRSFDPSSINDVLALQEFLASKGYFNASSTGFFGNVTLAAVKNYQNAIDVDVTGFVGPLTRAQIHNDSCGTQLQIPVAVATSTPVIVSATSTNPSNFSTSSKPTAGSVLGASTTAAVIAPFAVSDATTTSGIKVFNWNIPNADHVDISIPCYSDVAMFDGTTGIQLGCGLKNTFPNPGSISLVFQNANPVQESIQVTLTPILNSSSNYSLSKVLNFTLAAPTLIFTSPQAYGNITRNTYLPILWSTSGIASTSPVSIDFTDMTGTTFRVAQNLPNTGSYQLYVAHDVNGQVLGGSSYSIKVCAQVLKTSSLLICDFHDGMILPPPTQQDF